MAGVHKLFVTENTIRNSTSSPEFEKDSES